MNPIRFFVRQLLLIAALVCNGAAFAHGIWFGQRAGEFAMIYGHGAEDLNLVERQQRVTSIAGFDAALQPVAIDLKPSGGSMLVGIANRPAIVAATLDNGIWTRGADGKWLEKTKDAVPGAKESGHALKYAVHLREHPKAALKPVPGLAFQIIPVSSNFPQQRGQPLEVLVLFNGKPAAGAKLWDDYVNDPDQKPKAVRKNGTATLSVRNQGLNVIKAEFESPPADAAKADKQEHLATLSFVLGHRKE